MNMPKTYNEFSSWYYAQKLRNYYTLSRDDVDLIAQILLNGGCAQGDGTGFSLIDSIILNFIKAVKFTLFTRKRIYIGFNI